MEMLDLAASDTFCVKMLATVTACPNVLVDVTFSLLVAEGTQDILAAKLPQLTVKTAPSTLGIPVENHAQLLNRKLPIGVLLQKINEPLTPIRFVNLSHFHAFQEFENHSQIITPNA